MPEDSYMVPQAIGFALMTGRGVFASRLGVGQAKEMLEQLNEETLVEILKLIGDLIDDKFKLSNKVQQLSAVLEDLRNKYDELSEDEEINELLAEVT